MSNPSAKPIRLRSYSISSDREAREEYRSLASMEVCTFMMAEFSILSFARPGGDEIPIGVLVFDNDSHQMRAQFRKDWSRVAPPEDAEVLSAISEDLIQIAGELGGSPLLAYLEDTCSHALRISVRSSVQAENLFSLLERLYASYIERPGAVL